MNIEFQKLMLATMSIEKQQAAAISMLESALIIGDAANIKQCRDHAHDLLSQFMDSKAMATKAIKEMISGDDSEQQSHPHHLTHSAISRNMKASQSHPSA